jgi:glyoxylase-like metal-dependent hydrolase (beta-lactamase superfamily II)
MPPSLAFPSQTLHTLPRMAVQAAELQPLGRSLFIWQAFVPKVKADLFSTALLTPAGLLLVDPIPLAQKPRGDLEQNGPIAGIIVTSANHIRAASEFARRFSVSIFAHRDSGIADNVTVDPGSKILDFVDVIAIDGAAPGEIALHSPFDKGTLIVGDALINLEPDGFSLLPKKYCSNQKEMRRSLRQLLSYRAERMLFAHGTPILTGAHARLQQLLDADS